MSDLEETQISKMIDLCEKMLNRSYCIYSKFPVSAVLLTDCGQVITGCNVENSSYGLSICAERTAVVKAVSEGYRKFKACFVMTNSPDFASPCGACRQFLCEFGLDLKLVLISRDRNYKLCTLREMLPMAFTPDELEKGITKV